MKKIIVMLVIMFVAVTNAAAQMVVKETPVSFTLVNGYVYDRTQVPGGMWVRAGEDFSAGINRYFLDLRRRDPAEAQRQYNAFMLNGGLNGITPVDIVSVTGMGSGMMVGGAGMMMGGGTGAAMGGMVMGSGGMAGANSNVVIDNQNMMSTIGSGLNMYYDTGSNSIHVSGDPLMAAGRLFNFIGGSKKRQQTTNNAGNGNVRVIYVDAATGQEVAAPRSNTRSTATTPTTTTRTTTTTTTRSNATNYSSYNFASGF